MNCAEHECGHKLLSHFSVVCVCVCVHIGKADNEAGLVELKTKQMDGKSTGPKTNAFSMCVWYMLTIARTHTTKCAYFIYNQSLHV